MWTSHGHQIPNTPVDPEGPAKVARCGGPGLCNQCSTEILHGLRSQKAMQREQILIELPDMRQYDKARMLVAQYINGRITDTEIPEITLKEIYVVWFCKTLQNWKALITTNIPDGMFFEVTYDGDKKETYLDAYVKYHNIAVADGKPMT